jgi:branched-chain amino acid aminotransferase
LALISLPKPPDRQIRRERLSSYNQKKLRRCVMPISKSDKIWFNGEFVPWDEAQVHVMTHALHYGSSVFEGIRAYKTVTGPAVWLFDGHLKRLFDSAKIYRMEIPYSFDEIKEAILETIRVNGHEACYIRPIAFRGYGEIGVDPRSCPVDVAIATIELGRYLGQEAIERGVDVCVSSWRRMAPDTFPALAKSGANYANSQLIKMEALGNGYVEGIAMDVAGYVSEGSGENLFIVRNGTLITPPLSFSVLGGLTRGAVITLAQDLGLPVQEQAIPRELLYIADEVFFTGTAAEITPIRSIDKMPIGAGRRGPVTERLQVEFFGITEGEIPDRHGWLTPV